VTLTDSGFQNSSPPQTLQPVLYLVSNNQAFIIGTDPAVSFGFMTPQTIPQSGFSSSSLSGTYAGGSLAPVDPVVSNVVSIAIAVPGSVTVTADVSNESGLSQIQAASASQVGANGRVQLTLNNNVSAILYMVSPPPTPPTQGPPSQFFQLSADQTARVDIFQQ
jgi:hypothetical protein